MSEKIVTIENRQDPYSLIFDRILNMVPDREREDKKLQRLLAFRLRRDGEAMTIEFLVHKIREMLRCAYTGSLYDFLKDDQLESECQMPGPSTVPPNTA